MVTRNVVPLNNQVSNSTSNYALWHWPCPYIAALVIQNHVVVSLSQSLENTGDVFHACNYFGINFPKQVLISGEEDHLHNNNNKRNLKYFHREHVLLLSRSYFGPTFIWTTGFGRWGWRGVEVSCAGQFTLGVIRCKTWRQCLLYHNFTGVHITPTITTSGCVGCLQCQQMFPVPFRIMLVSGN